MSRQELIIKIKQKLAEISAEVQIAAKANLLDFHVILEDILIPVLDELLDYNLQNTNKKPNFPGIDLLDRNKKIGFQVTGNLSSTKIKETVDKIVDNDLEEEVDELYFLILSSISNVKKESFTKNIAKLPSSIKCGFDTNYLDFSKLFSRYIEKYGNVEKIWSVLKQSYNGKFTKIEDWEDIISKDKTEQISSNLAKISFPGKLFIGHLLPEVITYTGKSSRQRIFNYLKDIGEGFNGSWIIFENNIYTFYEIEKTPLQKVIDIGTIEPHDIEELLEDDRFEIILKSLLRFTLKSVLYNKGIVFDLNDRTYSWVIKDRSISQYVKWGRVRKSTRAVYDKKKDFSKLFTFTFDFHNFKNEWYISIKPSWKFADCSKRNREKLLSKQKSLERNSSIKSHSDFIIHILQQVTMDDVFYKSFIKVSSQVILPLTPKLNEDSIGALKANDKSEQPENNLIPFFEDY